MKNNYTYLFLLFFTTVFYAQNGGIGYQAIIYASGVQTHPGVQIEATPLSNKQVCLRFTFLDADKSTEYQETTTVTTDEFGMVNTIIGQGIQSSGYASDFEAITWNDINKTLVVELDKKGLCSNFTEISNQPFSTAPFAYNAITANNVSGIVAVVNGGTGADNVEDAVSNLGLGNVDNTADVDKPMSSVAQAAWELNVEAIYEEAAIARAAEAALTDDLATETSRAIAAEGFNTTAIEDEATTAREAESTLRSDLNDTQTALSLKANIDSPTFTGTVSGITKWMVGLGNVENTADLDKVISTATQAALDAKENTANKSTNIILDADSDIKFPSVKAIKSYVDAKTTFNAITTKTANYTALSSDYAILCNSSGGAFTLSLPAANTLLGKEYIIRVTNVTAYGVTISPALKLTNSISIASVNYPRTIRVLSDGTDWNIIE